MLLHELQTLPNMRGDMNRKIVVPNIARETFVENLREHLWRKSEDGSKASIDLMLQVTTFADKLTE